MEAIPNASYSMTLRVEFPHRAGALGKILTTVGEAGGIVGILREPLEARAPALAFERLTFNSLGGARVSGYAIRWKDDLSCCGQH